MATANPTAPAGATSVPESVIRAAAEAPSPPAFLELDGLLEKLLGLVSHLKCADSVLYDLQSVPDALQPAAIVMHDAVNELDQLHNRLQEWSIKADHEARYAVPVAGTDTGDAEPPESLAAHIADQQDRARELQDLLVTMERDPERNDNGILAIAVREARALNVALDRATLCKALAGESLS